MAEITSWAFLEQVALTIALTAAERALTPKPKGPAPLTPSNSLVKNPVANRMLAYGRTPIGGSVVYINQSGTKNEFLDLAFVMTTHEIDGIESLVLDNWTLSFDGTGLHGGGVCTGETDARTGATSTRYAGKVFANFHLGTSGDAADATLITNSGGQWTSTDSLSGCSYVYLRLTWDQNTFSSGIPNVYANVRGKKVMDPRTAVFAFGTVNGSGDIVVGSTAGLSVGMKVKGAGVPNDTFITGFSGLTVITSNIVLPSGATDTFMFGTAAWSNNAAMCYFDYHTDQIYGFRSVPSEWDLGYLTQACNDCDDAIALANDNFTLLTTGMLVLGPAVPHGTTISSLNSSARTATMSAAAVGAYTCQFSFPQGLLLLASITGGSTTMTFL